MVCAGEATDRARDTAIGRVCAGDCTASWSEREPNIQLAWEYRRGKLLERSVESARDRKAPALLPVQMDVPMKTAQEARTAPVSAASQPQRVEIEFQSGTRLRIWGGLGTERLQAILRELFGPC